MCFEPCREAVTSIASLFIAVLTWPPGVVHTPHSYTTVSTETLCPGWEKACPQ